jgi:hypothetical protein
MSWRGLSAGADTRLGGFDADGRPGDATGLMAQAKENQTAP